MDSKIYPVQPKSDEFKGESNKNDPTYYVTELDGCLNPSLDLDDQTPITVIEMFANVIQNHGEKPALYSKSSSTAPWTSLTYYTYFESCKNFAKSLLHLKIDQHRAINIIGFNSPQWFIANIGTILGGCVAAGLYPTSSSDNCLYISKHCEAELVVVGGEKHFKKFYKILSQLPSLKAIVNWGDPLDLKQWPLLTLPVYTWDEFLQLGGKVEDTQLTERQKTVHPGHCCSLIYTSGTTGVPKAVMISHDNITWNVTVHVREMIKSRNADPSTERVVSFLPMSHIAAQAIDIYCMMYCGGSVYFAQPDALEGSLLHTLKEVEPTLFMAVPRLWEKIATKLMLKEKNLRYFKSKLFSWGKKAGTRISREKEYGVIVSKLPNMNNSLANLLILNTIKNAMGLRHAAACYTSAAPISEDVISYLASLGLPVYEVYGLSESTGPHTLAFGGDWCRGFAGHPPPGTKTQIDPSSGELSIKGRHVFMGYLHDPESSAAALGSNRFLRSGDIAELKMRESNDLPFLRITGRIKELIITAGGENISPILVEHHAKSVMPVISNCILVGDGKRFLSLLLTIKTDTDPNTHEPTEMLSPAVLEVGRSIGASCTTVSEMARNTHWRRYVNEGIDKTNARSSSNNQAVRAWRILSADFTIEGGELTPTMKLKRSVILAKYKDVLNEIYEIQC